MESVKEEFERKRIIAPLQGVRDWEDDLGNERCYQ